MPPDVVVLHGASEAVASTTSLWQAALLAWRAGVSRGDVVRGARRSRRTAHATMAPLANRRLRSHFESRKQFAPVPSTDLDAIVAAQHHDEATLRPLLVAHNPVDAHDRAPVHPQKCGRREA